MSTLTMDRRSEIELEQLTRRLRSPFRSFVVRMWRRVVQAVDQRHAGTLTHRTA